MPEIGVKTAEGADGKNDAKEQHDDTVFSIASQFSANATNLTPESKPLSATLSPAQLCVLENRLGAVGAAATAAATAPPQAEGPQHSPHADLDVTADFLPLPPPLVSSSSSSCMTPISPSTDAEYDKLLDVEAVPMPDGNLCLLALPPECSQGEGPTSMQYLKLCSRYITNRKGVVSGILLVTSSKIFFDPCKSHPLVVEHGCEEYLLSCTVDSLASVSFYSDISHVHFNDSTQRWKGKRKKGKGERNAAATPHDEVQSTGSQPQVEGGEAIPALVSALTSDFRLALGMGTGTAEGEEESGETLDMAEAERQLEGSRPLDELGLQSTGALGAAVLSGAAATFCCGGQEAGSTEMPQKDKSELQQQQQQQQQPCLKRQIA
ncbi:nuclear receptor coactivator 7-like, partial [Engraulis encrasicolus]|uniref:nuclear receptor coactivator 7-like n=1 Tax=Engraulis encrasicolus TaxID=184585 RepID=UPI002FD3AB68